MSNSSSESNTRRVSRRQCPWCDDSYDEFRWHDDVEELPTNACESPLGFWIHEDGETDG